MKANLLSNKNVNSKNEVEDLEVKDKNDIDISTINLYSYAITIVYKYWREKDATNCLESFILFYLYHFLLITDDANVTNHKIYYSLNILKPDFELTMNLVLRLRFLLQ